MMKNYAAQCCLARESPEHARTAIFTALAGADMNQMKELEVMIMRCFARLFEIYVGSRCYSTFVMQMDLARRRLLRGEPLDICLPALSDLDAQFGPTNHRSLDVIRLRMEVLFQRKEYAEAITSGLLLIERASTILDDDWPRIYFLFKGGYHLGLAQYHMGNYAVAMQTLLICLEWEEEMWTVDDTGQFNSEKVVMLERLEEMAIWNGQVDKAAAWRSQRMQVFEQIAANDIVD